MSDGKENVGAPDAAVSDGANRRQRPEHVRANSVGQDVKTFLTNAEKALRSYESNSTDAQQNGFGPPPQAWSASSAAGGTSSAS